MRALGYPPGWMMEVQKTEAPVLAMFGKDGNGRLYINMVLKQKINYNRPLVKIELQKIFFLFLNQNICCGYSKEPSQ